MDETFLVRSFASTLHAIQRRPVFALIDIALFGYFSWLHRLAYQNSWPLFGYLAFVAILFVVVFMIWRTPEQNRGLKEPLKTLATIAFFLFIIAVAAMTVSNITSIIRLL